MARISAPSVRTQRKALAGLAVAARSPAGRCIWCPARGACRRHNNHGHGHKPTTRPHDSGDGSPGRDCVSAQMRLGREQLADRLPVHRPVPDPPGHPYRRRHHPWWSTEDPPREHRSEPVRPTAARSAAPVAAARSAVQGADQAVPSAHPPSRRPARTPFPEPRAPGLPTSGTRTHPLPPYRGSTLWRCRITQLRQQSL